MQLQIYTSAPLVWEWIVINFLVTSRRLLKFRKILATPRWEISYSFLVWLSYGQKWQRTRCAYLPWPPDLSDPGCARVYLTICKPSCVTIWLCSHLLSGLGESMNSKFTIECKAPIGVVLVYLLPSEHQQAQLPCSTISLSCITAIPISLSSRAKQ